MEEKRIKLKLRFGVEYRNLQKQTLALFEFQWPSLQ